jgi:hypothetical protein
MGGKAVANFAVQPSKQELINRLIVADVNPTVASRSMFQGYVEG